MKKLYNVAVTAVVFISLLCTSCDSNPAETTGNTNTEDLVDGADGGLDSLDLPADTTVASDSTAQ